MLLPGPLYDINSVIKKRLTEASKWSSGVLISTSDEDRELVIGNYKVYLIGAKRFNIKLKIKQLVFGIKTSLYKNKEQPFTHIVAYDPIRSGMTACVIKWLLRQKTKLVIEVNGVYQSKAIYSETGRLTIKQSINRRIKLAVCRFVLARSQAIKILFPSQLQGLYAPKKHQVVEYFANYLDLDSFTPAPGKEEVLLVGFPFHIKGVDILIKAFDAIASQFPDWRLKIIGFYNADDMQRLEKMIAGKSYIQYAKPVVRSELVKHIQGCSIFALPSRTEAMGRVLLEAMACGKPRVASNVDGIPMVVEHGVDGLLVEPDCPSALASALSSLMEDSVLREQLGKAAEQRAQKEFRGDRYFERMQKFFASID